MVCLIKLRLRTGKESDARTHRTPKALRAESNGRNSSRFAPALGVRARPRVAFCAIPLLRALWSEAACCMTCRALALRRQVGCSMFVHANARQALHSRPRRSVRKNVGGVHAAVDWASERRF